MQYADQHHITDTLNHQNTWKDCRDCPLCESRSKVVLWRGYVPADILFIGEAPGAFEDAWGYPFVGPTRPILDDLLRDALIALTLDNEQAALSPKVCFTNVVACLPPRESRGTAIREPAEEEITACSTRLGTFIHLVKPRAIVALGEVAGKTLKAMLPFEDPLHQVGVYRMTHPAALSRMGKHEYGPAYRQQVTVLAKVLAELVR